MLPVDDPNAGSRRGRFVDWATQRWVQATGRAVTWLDHPWLEAPVGDVDVIGIDFFHRLAARRGWSVVSAGEPRGLLEDFYALEGSSCRPAEVDPGVARFYERTSDYEFDVWSEWSGLFRPLGGALGALFSRRLQQLNVPLSPLDTKLGITSQVLKLIDDAGQPVCAAWIRETVATRKALYVGSYSLCRLPGGLTCIKVAFPLPHGYALVVMKPESNPNGSFTVRSEGLRFGDPGFYFFVEAEPGRGWARYVASLKEAIHVFRDGRGDLRADHDLRFLGRRFLRLHYRMRHAAAPPA